MAIQQYTIGRSADCTIQIDDNSQRVSRNHAVLTVVSKKKIYITDHSTNGTFVNGVKISAGSEYPIQRGDTISFANVAELDWNMISKSGNGGVIILIIAIIILIIGGGVGAYFYMNNQGDPATMPSLGGVNIEQVETQRQRLIESQKQDSISRQKLKLDADEKRDKLESEEASKRAEARRAAEAKAKKLDAERKAAEAKAKAAAESAVVEQKKTTLVF